MKTQQTCFRKKTIKPIISIILTFLVAFTNLVQFIRMQHWYRNTKQDNTCRSIASQTASKLELCADEVVVGGGVGWSYDRRRRRRRRETGGEHWNSALAGQEFFFWFYRGQPLYLWSPLGRWRRKVNCEYACSAQFHSLNELFNVHCLISRGSNKCNVEWWEDAESAAVVNTALENAVLEKCGNINMAKLNG